MNPKISIIVPVYNVEKYLEQCLDSLINQSMEDIEIICINDGSTDNSLELLKKLSLKDDRIKVFTQENSGLSATRNKGIDLAKGEYILFLDSDDWFELDTCKVVYENAQKFDSDLVIFLLKNYDESDGKYYEDNYYNNSCLDDKFLNTSFNIDDLGEKIFSLSVTAVNKLYKKSLLIENNIKFPVGLYFEDNPVYYEVMLLAKNISFVKEHFYLRRRHDSSITAKLDAKYYDTIKISNLLVDIFKKHNNSYNRFKKRFLNNRIFYLSRWFNSIDDEFRIGYWERLRETFKDIDNEVYEDYHHNLSPKNKEFFLNLINSETCPARDLIIASKFPPLNDVSGVVFSKRMIISNKTYDVIQASVEGSIDDDFNNVIDKFIDNRIVIEDIGVPNTIKGIVNFRRKGMGALEKINKEYKTISSRSWTIESHVLALDYKLKNKDTFWIAEFSDPLLFDMNNNERGVGNNIIIQDESYLNKINREIINFNSLHEMDLPLIKNTDSIYLIAEYLSFVFADKIRFTNEHQREIMLNQFPYDIKDFVMQKSEVSHHPVMGREYYYLKESDYKVDKNYLNLAYFGTYYGKRHLEYLFYSFEVLPKEVRDKIKIHFFVPNTEYLKEITKNLKISQNIIIGDVVPLLEFLNLTTKFDILIVNDSLTKEVFDKNPYLPSKLADYLGSGVDIWGFCEEGSILSKSNIKYKSNIIDFKSSKDTFVQIIKDKLNIELSIDDSYENDFLVSRCTFFNGLADDFNKNRNYFRNHSQNLNRNVTSLKKEKNELLSYKKEHINQINRLTEESTEKSKELEILNTKYKKLFNKNSKLENEINNYKIKLNYLEKQNIYLKKIFNSRLHPLQVSLLYPHQRNTLRLQVRTELQFPFHGL